MLKTNLVMANNVMVNLVKAKKKLKTTFYSAHSVLGYRGAWRRT